MTQDSTINLAELPAPSLTDVPDVETIFAQQKAELIDLYPAVSEALKYESDILVQHLRQGSYREHIVRRDFNDDARGTLLAFAKGGTLDQIAAVFGVYRQTIQAADPSTFPPTPEIKEDDDRFRRRIQLAPEGYTTHGTAGMYEFRALEASPLVKSAVAQGYQDNEDLERGDVLVTVLSSEGNGTASDALVQTVYDHLWQNHRTLGDHLIVRSAEVIEYSLAANLSLLYGPDETLVITAAKTAVQSYVNNQHNLGRDIVQSGLDAALHQHGVHEVQITSPNLPLRISDTQSPFCTSIEITVGGRDE
ncbi:MAG: baseplate assembly protein [Planktomarina sp.]